ncbi:MAG TPA: efflux RND transporter periplasmic adaptor subunit [Holophagaceae bacterium]|nr:efflux RND transporter periplasmic adaptor subunit [Holophagaceae bacterium]
MQKKHLLLGGGALLAVLVIAGLLTGGPRDESDRFSWDRVLRGDIRETLTASGEIRAKVQINVGTTVMGEIKKLHVVDGQDVRRGDLLVTIDPERLKQALIQGQAALDAARKDAERLEAGRKRAAETFTRMEALFHQKLVSDEDYRQAGLARESADLSAAAAKANVTQSEANLAGLRDGLSKCTLQAPISGRVTSLKAEQGETAIPGMSNLPGATLMVISDMSQILAEVKVSEGEVVRTKVGQTAQVAVEALPGRVFPGTVVEVATGAEKTGQDANLYKVKVMLDMKTEDIPKLRPGMSARAVILTSEAKAVLQVPLQSVLEREGSLEEARQKGLLAPPTRTVVMVVKGGHAQEREVRTGIASTQFIQVLEGVAEGDQVLTGPLRKLKELKDKASVQLKARSDADLAATLEKGKK